MPGRLLAAFVLWLLAACGSGESERERCAQCGMFVDIAPSWTTGATTASGDPIRFDTPRCLAGWWRTPSGRGARDAWVTSYYDQSRLPAADAHFVLGSDVIGPMGPDFVPLGTAEQAARFRADHHGTRVLRFPDLDPSLLR
jgi:nitrous oxide reductase accessory protein NosL